MIEYYEDLINNFNEQFSTEASLCVNSNIGWDLDGCSAYGFYCLLDDQQKASLGQVLYRYLGGYCSGPHYEKEGTAGFKLCSNSELIERFYPISSNEVSSRLVINYRSTQLNGGGHPSRDRFDRWWANSFDELSAAFPEQSKKVEAILTKEILDLANIARLKGYRSEWVFHRFQEKLASLKIKINQDILQSTTCFFEPALFYNEYSPKLVSLTEKEQKELRIQFERLLDRQDRRW